jgi:hypothetical protein
MIFCPMNKVIEKLLSLIKLKSRHRATGFAIGNTSGFFSRKNFYTTPLRETAELIYGGVIVKDVKTANRIAKFVDGQVEFVFVDAEKKIKNIYYGPDDVGNIERAVKGSIFKSQVLTYKGNDLAVEAVDLLLGQLIVDLAKVRIAIIGAGNLGSKIALKLVERGAHIKTSHLNLEKLKRIIRGLNEIKSEHTLASIGFAKNNEEACRGAHIIVACTNKKAVVTKQMIDLMSKDRPPILLDAGKGCFNSTVTKNSKNNIYRLDISHVQKYLFSAAIQTRQIYNRPIGRKIIDDHGIVLVSLGLLGNYGEIIVDNIESPKQIIGIANGQGSLIEDMTEFKDKLEILKKLIKLK